MVVAQLNEDDFGSRAGANPSDGAIAGGVVSDEQWFDVRGNKQALVGLVRHMERADARRDGMLASRSDQMFLTELHRRTRNRPLTFQAIETAHDFLVPPRPLLEIQDAVMQDDDALSALHKIAQVLFALLVQVAGEIVENQHVLLRTDVLLKSQRAVRDQYPAEVFVAIEQSVERGFVIMSACNHEHADAVGIRARHTDFRRQRHLAGRRPFGAAQEGGDESLFLHGTEIVAQCGAENTPLARSGREEKWFVVPGRSQNFRAGQESETVAWLIRRSQIAFETLHHRMLRVGEPQIERMKPSVGVGSGP